MTQGGEPKRRSFARSYLHGLHHSARENVSAYGYSVTITASFGLLVAIMGSPSVLEDFVFAGGAIFWPSPWWRLWSQEASDTD